MYDMVGGYPCSHLRLVVVNSTIDTSHFDANASQIIKLTLLL